MESSGQRYLITDLADAGLSKDQTEAISAAGPLNLPPDFPADLRDFYPWSEPIIFRSRRYLVHGVEGRPVGELTGSRP